MGRFVIDTYALMAFLRDEPGADEVQQFLERAGLGENELYMSEVNYAETKYMTLRKRGRNEWNRVKRLLPSLPIQFYGVSRAHAERAADFKAKHSISLADAFAAALASELDAELVTGDPEFKGLENDVHIRWIRT